MDKKIILDAVKATREKGPKRKFTQSFDLILNLKDIDVKKEGNKIDYFFALPFGRGKKIKICAFVDNELLKQAKEMYDSVIFKNEFDAWGDIKKQKKLAKECTYFIAQANLMGQLASVFGKVLGPRGKMPNPKADCVVPANKEIKSLYERLQKTVRIATKNEPIIKVVVGSENMKDEEIAENIFAAYNSIISTLPQGEHSVKNFILKLTMGPKFVVKK